MVKAGHMGISASQSNCHAKSYSCPIQSTTEGTSESVTECKFSGISEQKHPLTSQPVQTELGNTTIGSGASDALQPSSEDAPKSSSMDKSPIPKLIPVDQKIESVLENTDSELVIASLQKPLKENVSPGYGIVGNATLLPTLATNETVQALPQDDAKCSLTKDLKLPCKDASGNSQTVKISEQSISEQKISKQSISEHTPKFASNSAYGEQTALHRIPSNAVDKHGNCERPETPHKDAVNGSSKWSFGVKTTAKSRKKCALRSLRRSDRVLRSRSQEKSIAPAPSANQPIASSNTENTRKKRKKRRRRKIETNEYAIIRKHLRYLLNRINYEQSLITAYSSEGWKGLSLEKLKPEKELQRATSEILRRKSKIRDLFQRIDSLCAEGRFPESLFDSEGQISSEDIFCAKCGSKDLTADNDIILCDGACDRGFHQFCLVPPLLKADIPPGDEGWLCPGCDCKVDCIDWLNKSQGTNVTISDSWEKVFPEVASAGQKLDENFGLSSDDSDDDNFDPDRPEMNEKSQGDESGSDSSDDSDFTSDELEAPHGDKQQLGLSSEDSEDNDYDPDAPDFDDNLREESSSSDFTSASEDLAATLDSNEMSTEDKIHMSIGAQGDSVKKGAKRGRKKKQVIQSKLLSRVESHPISSGNSEDDDYDPDAPNLDDLEEGSSSSDFTSDSEDLNAIHESDDLSGEVKRHLSAEAEGKAGSEQDQKRQSMHSELLSILDSNPVRDRSTPISRKRSVERLDYKKLYDETYGNVASDSSDDEDFTDAVGPIKRRKSYGAASTSENGIAHVTKTRKGYTPKRGRRRFNSENTSISPTKVHEGLSACKTVRTSTYKRLGEAVTQGLFKSFKENQYPDRAKKETLAKELGITFQQVSKWFENARWSFNHSPAMDVKKTSESSAKNPEPGPGAASACGAQSEEPPKISNAVAKICNHDAREIVSGIPISGMQNLTTPTSRKRKQNSDDQIIDLEMTEEEVRKASGSLPKVLETEEGAKEDLENVLDSSLNAQERRAVR